MTTDLTRAREALEQAKAMLGDCELNMSNFDIAGDYPGTVEYLNNCAIEAWRILDNALTQLSQPEQREGEAVAWIYLRGPGEVAMYNGQSRALIDAGWTEVIVRDPRPTSPPEPAPALHRWNRMDRPRECVNCGFEEHDGSGIGYEPCSAPALSSTQVDGDAATGCADDEIWRDVRAQNFRDAAELVLTKQATQVDDSGVEAGEVYLITKNGMYYRAKAQGYTSSRAEAGRYTLEEAIAYSHPNGPDGPRDGISYEAADTLTPAQPAPITEKQSESLHKALIASFDEFTQPAPSSDAVREYLPLLETMAGALEGRGEPNAALYMRKAIELIRTLSQPDQASEVGAGSDEWLKRSPNFHPGDIA